MSEANQANDDAIARTLRELLLSTRTNRSIVWKFVDDHLEVVYELVEKNPPCFAGTKLSDQESSVVVIEIFSRLGKLFKDELFCIDFENDPGLAGEAGILSSLIELGNVQSSLIAILRRGGKLWGFLELQQVGSKRQFTEQDKLAVQQVLPKLGIQL
ncbi:MAG: hypothetical protein C5B53_08290 [Candidatus Melainabacteria bacterium]|nr:MAG: hypothetical protein C5B53_08290 [Candidatus Melainabacteria bacterium]